MFLRMAARSASGRIVGSVPEQIVSSLDLDDALELQHDPQRGRNLGHVLLSFGGAPKQAGELAPRETSRGIPPASVSRLGPGRRRERRQLHDAGEWLGQEILEHQGEKMSRESRRE
jgi:hypothetical protein